MTVFDDLQAEEDRLEAILGALDDDAWRHRSAAVGWSVADVVLHLAQSEEMVISSSRTGAPILGSEPDVHDLDSLMDSMVRAERAERAEPEMVFERWRSARREALDLLRRADPAAAIAWATNPLRPATLATTRLAEHWAHGLDITAPLDIAFEDTARLEHVAWLAHRSLPYAFALAGKEPAEVRCELSGPGGEVWEFGPAQASSVVTGPAGDFCRVGAQRLPPEQSRLVGSGPHGTTALRLLRNYAA